jgi:hypothetical protein
VNQACVKFLCIVLLACGLGAGKAQAETIRDTLEAFGFFGVWAQQCDQPTAPDNTLRSAKVEPTGETTFSENLGPESEPNIYVVLAAKRSGEHTLTLRIKLNGLTEQELTMRRDGDRIRTYSNRDLGRGRLIVKDGVVRGLGQPTPWLRRCSAASQ